MFMLQTARLTLREFTENDWLHIQAFQSEAGQVPRSEEASRALLERILGWQNQIPRLNYRFALVSRTTGQFIGWCDLYHDPAQPAQAEIGFRVDWCYQNEGYATEAAQAVIEFGRQTLLLHRVWAECAASNPASARVLSKLGMQLEKQIESGSETVLIFSVCLT